MKNRGAFLATVFIAVACEPTPRQSEAPALISDLEYEVYSDALPQLLDGFRSQDHFIAVGESTLVVPEARPLKRKPTEVDTVWYSPEVRANESLFVDRTDSKRENIVLDNDFVARYNKVAQSKCAVGNRFPESLNVYLCSAEERWPPTARDNAPEGSSAVSSGLNPVAIVDFTRVGFSGDSSLALFQCRVWRAKDWLGNYLHAYGYGCFVLLRFEGDGHWRVISTRQTWIT